MKPHVLQTAAVLVAIMLGLLFGLVGCADLRAMPTPFETGRQVGTPAGCADAQGRGHEC